MIRSFVYDALILRVKPSGESNRDVWFLSAEEGILRATVFGGPKSKLRSHAAPFHRGKLWIYRDPVRDSRKVTDFDVRSWRPGIREMYERSAAASAVAETILAALGGGGAWPEALGLADRALDALDAADEQGCRKILLHFLWNWADHLGLRPALERCGSCGSENPGETLWFSPTEGAFLCPACVREAAYIPEELFRVGPGCRSWLLAVQDLDPARLEEHALDGKSAGEARVLVTAILASALGRRLATWDAV